MGRPKKALQALKKKTSFVYEFNLRGEIDSEESPICGGKVKVLVDGNPCKHRKAFQCLKNSLSRRQSGFLATVIEDASSKNALHCRFWVRKGGKPLGIESLSLIDEPRFIRLEKGVPSEGKKETFLFLDPQSPLPHLIIAGAGHIGRAIAHLGNLLSFEVIVIDDRPEFANRKRIPEADSIIVSDIGNALKKLPLDSTSYLVIVTRGHARDAEALRASIKSNAAYIGMIGSRRKIGLMREQFLKEGWATAQEFSRVCAPIGIDIHSETVEEIAVSIAAQLILVRHLNQKRED